MKGFKWLVGFRKFTIAIIYLVVAVVLLLTGEIPKADWLENVSKTIMAFFATNIGEHLINVGKVWINEKFKKKS